MDKSTYLIPLIIIGCLLFLYFFRQEEVEPVEVIKEVEVVEEKKETPVYIVNTPKKEDGYHTEWNEWGVCSKDCGGGNQSRERSYVSAQNGGMDLSEAERINLIENRNCNEQACPVNGYHSEWSEWSECNKTCGGGIQYRNRTYTSAKYGGVDLEDKNNIMESRECNAFNCPENGYHTEWNEWSDCDKDCGGGIQTRERSYNSAKYGGLDLEDKDNTLESRKCNSQSCPIDGSFTPWEQWSDCSKSCGGGIMQRTRDYLAAQFGGIDLSLDERNNLIENKNCNEHNCPENGYHSDWNNWSSCDKTCGGGSQSRNRTYTPAKYGGVDLSEAERINLIENRNCNEQACPVNGYHSTWSNWSTCDKTCGGGTQRRSRIYTPATNGGVDLVDRNNIIESQICNTQVCPVAYKFILTTDKYTYTPLSVTSPNGLYKFEWNNTPDLILYKLINGSWTIASKIIIWNSNNTGILSCDTEGVATYNTAYTTSSRLGTISSIKGAIKGFAINDNGQLVLIDYLGAIGLVILSPSSPYLTK